MLAVFLCQQGGAPLTTFCCFLQVSVFVEDGIKLGLLVRGGSEYGLGIFIADVDPNGAAERAGLKVGHKMPQSSCFELLFKEDHPYIGTLSLVLSSAHTSFPLKISMGAGFLFKGMSEAGIAKNWNCKISLSAFRRDSWVQGSLHHPSKRNR